MVSGKSAISALACSSLMFGCAIMPQTAEQGRIEIQKVKDGIECELAAVAQDPQFAKRNIPKWSVKSTLDLTLVTSVGADGNAVFLLPYTASQVRITPSAELSRRDTSVAHLEFTTSISDAVMRIGHDCRGSDPSQAGWGIAAWFTAVLQGVNDVHNAGLAYTSQFEVTADASTRFGYTVLRTIINPDLASAGAGVGATRIGTHRLTVAIATPPSPRQPTEVFVVNMPKDTTKGLSSETIQIKPRPRGPIPPTKDDSRLNRLLDNQRPVTLEPGTR